MKRIFITLILALFTLTINAQVKVLGKIEPNGPTDTYPTHVDSLGKGGFVAVKTWQERNSIPLLRRKAGMMVSIKSATVDSLYRLGVGLTNADWLPYVASVDVSGKANLAGGNSFTGLQELNYNDSRATITSNEFKIVDENQDAITSVKAGNINVLNRGAAGEDMTIEPLAINFNKGGRRTYLTSQGEFLSGDILVAMPTSNGTLATQEWVNTNVDLSGKADVNLTNVKNIPFIGQLTDSLLVITSSGVGKVQGLATQVAPIFTALNDKANLVGSNTFTGTNTINNTINIINPNAEYTTGLVTASNLFEIGEDLGTRYATLNGNGLYFMDGALSESSKKAWYTGFWTRYFNNNHYLTVQSPMLTKDATVTYPSKSGTIATINPEDIGKMFLATASGDGSTFQFSFPHGLSYLPTMVLVNANSVAANGRILVEVDSTNVHVIYVTNDFVATPPPAGTNNLKWTIMVK